MRNRKYMKKGSALILSVILLAGSFFLRPLRIHAENFQFITAIRLAAGENAEEELEEAGYHVMTNGLNAGTENVTPVYVGYKLNDGEPVTDVILRENTGESFESEDGILYVRAGEADVDEGLTEKTGSIYYTQDPEAGAPLVALEIERAYLEDDQELLAIPNDGSEVVRKEDGTPADLEAGNSNVAMYMLKIRDGLVCPYISTLGLVAAEDRMEAVYQAALLGYNYFIDGDLDNSTATYTILAYNRTAVSEEAITSVVAVTAALAEAMEEKQLIAMPETEKLIDELNSEEVENGTVPEYDDESDAYGTTEGTSSEIEEVTTEAAAEETTTETAAEETTTETAAEETTTEIAAEETTTEIAAEETTTETAAEEATTEIADEETTTETEDEESTTETETEESTSETESEEPMSETESESESDESTEPEEILTAETIEISGIEYTRIASRAVDTEVPYYLYATKDAEAGNPVTMLYISESKESAETFMGTWAYGYFSSKGVSYANTYKLNESILSELQYDMTVYVHVPVSLLAGNVEEIEEAKAITPEISSISLSYLTKKEGLPETSVVIQGLKKAENRAADISLPERDTEKNQFTGSAFGKSSLPILIAGGIVILGMGTFAGVKIVKAGKKNRKEE